MLRNFLNVLLLYIKIMSFLERHDMKENFEAIDLIKLWKKIKK